MPKERPLWRGAAFRLCVLSAALLLCLQLAVRRSWCPEERPRLPAVAASGRAVPQPRGTAAASGRRRVTYVRSGRRGGRPGRKVGQGRAGGLGQPQLAGATLGFWKEREDWDPCRGVFLAALLSGLMLCVELALGEAGTAVWESHCLSLELGPEQSE